MGTQGEIFVVYGVELPAKVVYEASYEENPVIYQVGESYFCDDEDFLNGAEGVLENLAFDGVQHAGIQSSGYGALDPNNQKLSVRPNGHSGEFGGNMGARHFVERNDFTSESHVGGQGKALVGYAVSNASYMNRYESVAPMDKIKEVGPKLIAEIKEKLGVDVEESQLGLHLVFDWLQGY